MTKPLFRRLPTVNDTHRLADLSEGYRVASEALTVAADAGCSDAVYEALWALCQREEIATRMGTNPT